MNGRSPQAAILVALLAVLYAPPAAANAQDAETGSYPWTADAAVVAGEYLALGKHSPRDAERSADMYGAAFAAAEVLPATACHFDPWNPPDPPTNDYEQFRKALTPRFVGLRPQRVRVELNPAWPRRLQTSKPAPLSAALDLQRFEMKRIANGLRPIDARPSAALYLPQLEMKRIANGLRPINARPSAALYLPQLEMKRIADGLRRINAPPKLMLEPTGGWTKGIQAVHLPRDPVGLHSAWPGIHQTSQRYSLRAAFDTYQTNRLFGSSPTLRNFGLSLPSMGSLNSITNRSSSITNRSSMGPRIRSLQPLKPTQRLGSY